MPIKKSGRGMYLCQSFGFQGLKLASQLSIICSEFLDSPADVRQGTEEVGYSLHLGFLLLRLDHFSLGHRVVIVNSAVHGGQRS